MTVDWENFGYEIILPTGSRLYVGPVPERTKMALSIETNDEGTSVMVLGYFNSKEAAQKFVDIMKGAC
ncbi:hypothetical protein [Nonomuraea roseoviolacea]|uniref:hypothetical protein n=1 Tax=Nonomuraea roseoviolacea TaxID=103837 RepID=UPI0031D8661E